MDTNNQCTNVFSSDKNTIKEAFTDLWIRVINEKENSIIINNNDGQPIRYGL